MKKGDTDPLVVLRDGSTVPARTLSRVIYAIMSLVDEDSPNPLQHIVVIHELAHHDHLAQWCYDLHNMNNIENGMRKHYDKFFANHQMPEDVRDIVRNTVHLIGLVYYMTFPIASDQSFLRTDPTDQRSTS